MSVTEILTCINHEDRLVPYAVAEHIDAIGRLVDGIVGRMRKGGRVFYVGAGPAGGSESWTLPRFLRLTE